MVHVILFDLNNFNSSFFCALRIFFSDEKVEHDHGDHDGKILPSSYAPRHDALDRQSDFLSYVA